MSIRRSVRLLLALIRSMDQGRQWRESGLLEGLTKSLLYHDVGRGAVLLSIVPSMIIVVVLWT